MNPAGAQLWQGIGGALAGLTTQLAWRERCSGAERPARRIDPRQRSLAPAYVATSCAGVTTSLTGTCHDSN